MPLNPLVNQHTGPHANELTAACVSSSGETLAFGFAAAGYVHAWSAATAVYDRRSG